MCKELGRGTSEQLTTTPGLPVSVLTPMLLLLLCSLLSVSTLSFSKHRGSVHTASSSRKPSPTAFAETTSTSLCGNTYFLTNRRNNFFAWGLFFVAVVLSIQNEAGRGKRLCLFTFLSTIEASLPGHMSTMQQLLKVV